LLHSLRASYRLLGFHLLENGADANLIPKGNDSNLIIAAKNNNTEIVRILLDHDADVNTRNQTGATALVHATLLGNLEMVKVLLDNGADPTLGQSEGVYSLDWATQLGFVSIAELIRSSISGNKVTASPGSTVTFTGTGWVTLGGYIVTNYHVIENHVEIKVRFNSVSDNEYLAKALVSDKSNDLAILKLEDSPAIDAIPGLPIPSTFPSPGEDVFTLGYPKSSIMGKNPKITDGIVSALSGIQDDPTVMQVTVPIQSGNSGGPLLTMRGDVVGVTTSTLRIQVTERGIIVFCSDYEIRIITFRN